MELIEGPQFPWQSIVVAPLGDIQAGSSGTDWEHLERHIDRCLKADAWFYGTGDFTDFLSPSNRRALAAAGLYDTATDLIEEWQEQIYERLTGILKPTVGRWLCLHEGHHYYQYGDGSTTDTRLCAYLCAPFAATSSLCRLRFKSDQLQRAIECLIWGHHGLGSSSDPTAKLQRVAPGFPQVDIFIQGHNSQIAVRVKDTIEVYGRAGHLKMRNRQQTFIAAGGFMRGYQAGSRLGKEGRASGSYVEKLMLPPTAIGGPLIRIEPQAKSDYSALSIRVEVGD